MAIYAIGDVQGCCDELERLIASLRIDPDRDELFSLMRSTGGAADRGASFLFGD